MHFRLIMCDVERSLQAVLAANTALRNAHSAATEAAGSREELDGQNESLKYYGGYSSIGLYDFGRSSINTLLEGDLGIRVGERLTRQLSIARGELRFNLVRLRSEFQALFEFHPAGVAAGGSADISSYRSSVALVTRSRRSLAQGAVSTEGRRDSLRRLRSSSVLQRPPSHSHGWSLFSLLGLHPKECVQEVAPTAASQIMVGGSLPSTATSVFDTLYGMLFGSSEHITSTTQYSSLHRDLLLLESPDFEVSLTRKISTAARMRVSYKCLAPLS